MKCEERIEKSVRRITVWHHKACRVMTNGDPRDGFFYPLTRMEFFLAHTVFIYILIYLFQNKLPEVPDYAKMQFHMMTLL